MKREYFTSVRGGSWFGDPRNSNSANRDDNLPVNRSNFIGFRVSVVIEKVKYEKKRLYY